MNDRAGRVLLTTVAVLVVLAVIGGVVAALRPPPSYPPDSPEAVLQSYLEDVLTGDLGSAATYLDPEGECTLEDLEDSRTNRDTDRIVLRDARTSGDTATVRVDLVQETGGLFSDSWTNEQRFTLRSTDEGWVLTGQPWPMFSCREGRP